MIAVVRFAVVALLCACRFGFDVGSHSDATSPLDDVLVADAVIVPENVNRAFVTSQTFVPAGFGGRNAADAACAQAAQTAGFTGTFIAFVSTSAESAFDRLRVARGWYRTDGLPLVDTVDDLLARRQFRPVQVDELGRKVDDIAATGTNLDGSLGANCSDWTAQTSYTMGPSDGEEVAFTGWGSRACATPAHLLCFQIDHQTPVVPIPDTGRIAFYVPNSWTVGGGIATADARCATVASDAGLSGSFLAFLPTSTASAASRFSSAGPTWVRRDGIRLAATAADVLAGALEAAISVQANGAHNTSGGNVITGSPTPTTPGPLTTTCTDWTSTTGSAVWGRPQQAGHAAFEESAMQACASLQGLYCLEQ